MLEDGRVLERKLSLCSYWVEEAVDIGIKKYI